MKWESSYSISHIDFYLLSLMTYDLSKQHYRSNKEVKNLMISFFSSRFVGHPEDGKKYQWTVLCSIYVSLVFYSKPSNLGKNSGNLYYASYIVVVTILKLLFLFQIKTMLINLVCKLKKLFIF